MDPQAPGTQETPYIYWLKVPKEFKCLSGTEFSINQSRQKDKKARGLWECSELGP